MEEKDLSILYECRTGSHAYGTSTPESDEDFRGFCVPPVDYFLGLKRFDQLERNEPTDRVIYDIRKFFKLASDCNPNIIEILFCDDKDIVASTPEGLRIRENRELFLSKKARYTFLGYAFAQLKRIRRHRHWLLKPIDKKPERVDFGLPEKKLVTSDHAGAFFTVLAGIMRGSVEEAKLSQETLEELREVNYIGLIQSHIPDDAWQGAQKLTGASDNFVEAMALEKGYTNALNEWKSYQNWKKTRNLKRAELESKCGYDSKHASHLVRLIRMGEEILTGKGVLVKRPDAEELLEIRNGSWSFEQVESFADGMDRRMDDLYKTSKLPKLPKAKRLNELCISTVESILAPRNYGEM